MSEAESAAPRAGRARRKVAVLGLGGLLLVATGAGGAWFAAREMPADGQPQPGQPGQAVAAASKAAPRKPLFTTLEVFTVNLQDPTGDRFAQIGVTLQYEDLETELAIKDHLPAIRNDILMLVSSKQVGDLLTIEGKQKLAQQIRALAARAIGAEPPAPGAKPVPTIRQVLFSQFILQ